MSRPADADVAEQPIDPDYPVTPVPAHARKSFFSLAVVLLGFTVFTPTMLAGAAIGPAFSFGGLLTVILAGSVILGTYVALMGYVGARTGLTTVVMARYSFGNRGSKLASIPKRSKSALAKGTSATRPVRPTKPVGCSSIRSNAVAM